MEERRRSLAELAGNFDEGALSGVFRLGYPMLRGRWDEMVGTDGGLRPHWDQFIAGLAAMPQAEMHKRWERALRLIRENGVTYNIFDDTSGLGRPWQLDPVPMILSAQEWRSLERGVMQRAHLLNHVLADLYSAQKLFEDGLLPPPLALANPTYLRPLRHVTPPNGVYLHMYAVDLARTPEGEWRVISDRCESPQGAGYALENRSIISRSLPDLLRVLPVRPLSPFFAKWRDGLANLAPRGRESARSVLLTPGPHTESYFEHSYLARQLGYTLVEAEDLTMRDERIFLKTLDGLQLVNTILRRTTGAYCDPLELRDDSVIGIPGLVQAVRAGHVLVANALGSGVLESGLISPYLATLCRHLLGESLQIPSAAAWWCGDEKSRRHVLERLDRLVIKNILAPPTAAPVFGDTLKIADRSRLIEAIRRAPGEYLAQERIRMSTAPIWTNGTLDPRPILMRVFAVAIDGDYVVMPGGLVRVAADRGGNVVSMQQGGFSKDGWVLDDTPEAYTPQVTTRNAKVELVRGARDLPSRVADNLFWMGRYIERVEDTTRLLRAALSRAGSSSGLTSAEELPMVLKLAEHIYRLPLIGERDEQVLAFARMHFDPLLHGTGLRAVVDRVMRTAGMARDRLSPDTWRALNRMQQDVDKVALPTRDTLEDCLGGLNRLILATGALSGLVMENMTRGLGWRFVDLGRRIERAVHLIDLLSSVLPSEGGDSAAALEVLLEISDSAMTYRSRYFSMPQFAPVLDLLLADESNPRSLAFQLVAISEHINHLAASRRPGFYGLDQRQIIWLTGAVRTADIMALAHVDEDGGRRGLALFFSILTSKLWELSETITREYFTHAVSRSSGPALVRELLP